MSFLMYEIAKNQEIQQRVQNEIDNVLKKHDYRITYDSVNEMKYLEACIDGRSTNSFVCQTLLLRLYYFSNKLLILKQKFFVCIHRCRFCIVNVVRIIHYRTQMLSLRKVLIKDFQYFVDRRV